MRKKLLSIILSLAIVLTMIPAIGSVAYADSSWANPRWNGQVAEWDPYPNATSYWIYVNYNGRAINGSGHSASATSYDAAYLFDQEGAGKYTFTVTPYVNGKYVSDDISELSPEYNYTPEEKTLGLPLNLRWDGAVAKWDAAENATKYRVTLYKEGSDNNIANHILTALEKDFFEILEIVENGKYYFTVESYRDGVYNTPVQSDKLDYITEKSKIKIPENLRWEGNVAKWDAVEDAISYWIWVYKNGDNINGYYASSNSYDVTELLNSKGCGSYTFIVSARKGEAYSYQSVLSSATPLHKGEVTTSIDNIVPATTTADGSYDIVISCKDCDKEISRENVAISHIDSVKLSATSYTYDGKVKSPSLTVKDSDGNALVKDVDYTVATPSGRTSVGTYTYKVTFIDKYSGEKSVSFKINPAAAAIKSVTSGSKKMTVKMTTKPSSKGASTYQIAYKQKGTSTWKKTTTTAASKIIKSLKKGKYYYVKVRAYKKIGTKTYYGAWSKTKLSKKIK